MLQNVKYELQELERLFSSEGVTGVDNLPTYQQQVLQEVERIKKTLIHEVFHFEDERHLERYIQYHQQALIQLMDKSAQASSDQSNKKAPFFQIMYHGFEDLLSFIERHFTKYFDQDAKAPEGYILISRKDTKVNLRKLQKMLAGKNADITLTELLLHVLKKIIEGTAAKSITYRKVLYVKEVQKELTRLLEKPLEGNALNDELRQVMYYLNYNSTRVLTYHAHFLSSLLDASEFRTEKIETLSFELKKITQAQVKPSIGYNLGAPSLKSQLIDYIHVELEYQERLQQLSNRRSDPPSGNMMDGFKLKFEASVSQLAYLLKLFLETKVIINDNLSQVMTFIVRFVTTKKSENISMGSLRSKFYSVESGTKESVRNMLLAMIQHIDRT
ncbi:hypothetical protein [Chryseolinea soli]|uniref:Uncharacterized protein n=1 Tax=Chryseolinea soli TaxID=2321403 RepID=A0A385SNV0_9BACT|nr:hypothetical protein [Chryseolinea soli]AYB32031.1 hypothetical protein D4L85_16295 [Chryseolinea soli]